MTYLEPLIFKRDEYIGLACPCPNVLNGLLNNRMLFDHSMLLVDVPAGNDGHSAVLFANAMVMRGQANQLSVRIEFDGCGELNMRFSGLQLFRKPRYLEQRRIVGDFRLLSPRMIVN